MPSRQLLLVGSDRQTFSYTLPEPRQWDMPKGPLESRIAYAAAHVVADPLIAAESATESALDWDATLAYRRFLWSYGLGVAEAMDTAQRGMGLSWRAARELIRRAAAEAKTASGTIACGVGTDDLPVGPPHDLRAVVEAYERQCEYVESCGSRIILMASRALAARAAGPDDYLSTYGRVLRQIKEPVILHWLGGMFDPALGNYWGSHDVWKAMDTCLALIAENRRHIEGIKISLLDASLETEMRNRLPEGVRMYTGDDFAYPDLILGDERSYSHALLGIFDAIAPAASVALQALDRGDTEAYKQALEPTVALSRTIFEAPTYNYKTGIVLLAYLNGYQRHFRMVGGKESARSATHFSRVLVSAAEAGLIIDPDLACQRMRIVLAQSGVY